VETYVELTTVYAEIMDGIYYGQLKQYFADTNKVIQRVRGIEGLFQDRAGAVGPRPMGAD